MKFKVLKAEGITCRFMSIMEVFFLMDAYNFCSFTAIVFQLKQF